MSLDPRQILIAPVVSEKSYSLIGENKYSFRVHEKAHKTQIRQAVEEVFDVKVESVNVLKVRPKPKRRGLQKGRKPGWKRRSWSCARATASRSSKEQRSEWRPRPSYLASTGARHSVATLLPRSHP